MTPTLKDPSSNREQNVALLRAIEEHLSRLSTPERKAFEAASADLNPNDPLGKVRQYDAEHAQVSHHSRYSETLAPVLTVMDKVLGLVSTVGEASVAASIAIGAVHSTVNVVISSGQFFDRVTDMMEMLSELLGPLAEYPQQERSDVFMQALADVPRWGGAEAHQLASILAIAVDALRRGVWDPTTRDDFLVWLSGASYEERHEEVYSTKRPGTGDWLLDDPNFETWRDSESPSLLWCQGGPGAGKSVLASNRDTQKPSQVSCALLKQLLRKRATIPKEFIDVKRDALPASTLGKTEYFCAVANPFRATYIIIDGLGECADDGRGPFMESLGSMLQQANALKVIIMSRETEDIRASRESEPSLVVLEIGASQDDIRKYVEAEVQALRSHQRSINGKFLYIKSDAVTASVVNDLIAKADGMFLWVALQLDNLCPVSTEKNDMQVVRAWDMLPRGIDATYRRILDQIEDEAPNVRRRAVAIPESLQDVDDVEDLDGSALFKVGSGLMAKSASYRNPDDEWTEGHIIRPLHFSVQECCVHEARNRHLLALSPDEELASICLTYLTVEKMFLKRLEDLPGELDYFAIVVMTLHEKFLGIGLKQLAGILNLRNSGWLLHERMIPGNSVEITHTELSAPDLLYATNLFGVAGLTNLWKDVKPPRLALNRACAGGHLGTVQRILQGGCEIDAPDTVGWTALHQAARRGDRQLIALLVQHGADLNAETPYLADGSGTAVYLAAQKGHIDLVYDLLAAGAEPSPQFWNLETIATHRLPEVFSAYVKLRPYFGPKEDCARWIFNAASCNNHGQVMNALLAHGLTVGVRDEAFENVCKRGDVAMAPELLSRCDDLHNEDDALANDLLIHAINGGHDDIVDLLLTTGIRVVATAGDADNALLCADPMLTGYRGETALHKAISNDDRAMVEAILKHPGVDLGFQFQDYATPLIESAL
ncbi:hypothetical protein B0A55_02917 [Friedmanniomyces simplex]|uniref:Nephrocystin 3-like N-terminal domain-containing protein n=1 Tax=Friedmanniomyces simplex TaxID=329884 RepID=A0A4V5NHV8_9PEZI|nr:hypothetical protein B0A55_02917 [Friedmanniomyces simplex]